MTKYFFGPTEDCQPEVEEQRGELTSRMDFFHGNIAALNDIAGAIEGVLEKLTGPLVENCTGVSQPEKPSGLFEELSEIINKYSEVECRLESVAERLKDAI